MARERMIALFDLSAKHRALPLGTGNKSERLLGYFTWHADDSPPVNPLGDLFKTQVWALARHVGVPGGDRHQAGDRRPDPRPDRRGRLRHLLPEGRPDPLLPDPRTRPRRSRRAGLHARRSGAGAAAARVDALEAEAAHRRGDVADGDRRVLSATGGLLSFLIPRPDYLMQGRHPRESEAVMSELMMPQHANIMGNVFGGVMLVARGPRGRGGSHPPRAPSVRYRVGGQGRTSGSRFAWASSSRRWRASTSRATRPWRSG